MVAIGVVCALLGSTNSGASVVLVVMGIVPPVLVLRHLVRKHPRAVDKDTTLRVFFTTFLPGSLLATVVQLVMMGALAAMCFSDQLDSIQKQLLENEDAVQKLQVNRAFGLCAYLCGMAFVALTEEVVKLGAVRWRAGWCGCRLVQPSLASPYAIVVYMTASAMGFSTMENLCFTCFLDVPLLARLLIGLARLLMALPLHTCCALFTAERLIHRELLREPVSWAGVLLPAFLVHGIYDFWGFLPLVLQEAWTVVPGIVCPACVFAFCVLVLRRKFRALNLPELEQRLVVEGAGMLSLVPLTPTPTPTAMPATGFGAAPAAVVGAVVGAGAAGSGRAAGFAVCMTAVPSSRGGAERLFGVFRATLTGLTRQRRGLATGSVTAEAVVASAACFPASCPDSVMRDRVEPTTYLHAVEVRQLPGEQGALHLHGQEPLLDVLDGALPQKHKRQRPVGSDMTDLTEPAAKRVPPPLELAERMDIAVDAAADGAMDDA